MPFLRHFESEDEALAAPLSWNAEMIRRCKLLEDFEREQLARPVDIEANFRIHDLLLEEARQLGVIPLKDPLDGIEEDIRRARFFRDL